MLLNIPKNSRVFLNPSHYHPACREIYTINDKNMVQHQIIIPTTNYNVTPSNQIGWISVFGTLNLPENFLDNHRGPNDNIRLPFCEEYNIESCLLQIRDADMRGPPLKAGYHILSGLDPRYCVQQVINKLQAKYNTDEFDFFYSNTLSNISFEDFQQSGFILFAQKGVDLNIFLNTLSKVEFERFPTTISFCRLRVGEDPTTEEEANLTVVRFQRSNISQVLVDFETGLKDGCFFHPGNIGVKMVFMAEYEEPSNHVYPPTPPYE